LPRSIDQLDPASGRGAGICRERVGLGYGYSESWDRLQSRGAASGAPRQSAGWTTARHRLRWIPGRTARVG